MKIKHPEAILLAILCTMLLVFTPHILFASDDSSSTAATTTATTKDIKRFQTQGEFGDVKEFLLQAIAGRGIKTSSTSYISKMLQRTREDVGGSKEIFKNAEAVGFCSATLSRQMMESDPHHIVFCPYTIVIYELAQQPGIIYLSYRRPFYSNTSTNDRTLKEIDELMSVIISEVVE
ncbi:DUF302 domain-containing protein [Kaarinaea lacus]